MNALSILFAAMVIQLPSQAPDRHPDVEVHIGDLDLTTQGGVRTLDRRLRTAIAISCGGRANDRGTLGGVYARCVKKQRKAIAERRDAAIAAAAVSSSLAVATQRLQ